MKLLSTILTILAPFHSMAHQVSSFPEIVAIAANFNVNLTWPTTHGCWCPAVFDEYALQGKAVDAMDTACKNFRQCINCVSKDAANCTNKETIEFYWDNTYDPVCGSGNNECQMMACSCHMNLFKDLLKNANATNNNPTITPGTEAQCIKAPGGSDSCCNAGDGKWTVFNADTHHCLADGKTKAIGDCNANSTLVEAFVPTGSRYCGYVLNQKRSSFSEILQPYNRNVFDVGVMREGHGPLSSISGLLHSAGSPYHVPSFHKNVYMTQVIAGCELTIYSDVCKPTTSLLMGQLDYHSVGSDDCPSEKFWIGQSNSEFCYDDSLDGTGVYYKCTCNPNRTLRTGNRSIGENVNPWE